MGFTRFGLSDQVIKGVQAAGYTTPTAVQSLAISPVLAGKDVIGCAQTGTGKTAAFVLPLLHRLSNGLGSMHREERPSVLVLTPTRELAQQVHDAVVTYGRFLAPRAVAVYGGVSMISQLKLLRRGVDIVIATPGRLLDHLQRRTINLSGIQVLVLDEADRMLDMGFVCDVRRIIDKLPKKRQTLMFSATLSRAILELAADILHNPETVQVGDQRNPVETIAQHFYSASREAKMGLLLHALDAERMQSVLVFSRTKHGADKICRRLERQGIRSMVIHSNRTQSQRQRALDGFREGRFRVLVATDIASRGIDVDGISHVVNFDIPHYAEDYIHRIGRTGRAGSAGDAITFVSDDERQHLKKIQQFTGVTFPLKKYPGFTPFPREKVSSGKRTISRRGHSMHHHLLHREGC
jgi:ATP-dependent RNA helicase RhlE